MTASSLGAGRCEVIEACHNIGCSLTLIVGGDSTVGPFGLVSNAFIAWLLARLFTPRYAGEYVSKKVLLVRTRRVLACTDALVEDRRTLGHTEAMSH